MTPPGKSLLRLALSGVAAIYLAGDLLVWHGPLRRALAQAMAARSPVAARVGTVVITRSQVERAVAGQLWLEGKTLAALDADQRQAARRVALDDLIDRELLRASAGSSNQSAVVSEAAVTARLQRFQARFESPADLAAAMHSQGIASGHDLRQWLADQLRQESSVEARIAPLVAVSEPEIRQWFAGHPQDFVVPERVEVRHLFLPTLDHPPETARATLAAALVDLTAGRRDFATLARDLSEDPATKDNGGALGWMTRNRLPDDFAAAVFSLAPNQPTLVRTHVGWHLVEVTARQPARPQSYAQAQPEIRSALQAVKRRAAVTALRADLRQAAAGTIEVVAAALAD